MKSAIELAMERAGGSKKLTDAQKKQIADIREKAKAKRAEEEIMFNQRKASLRPGPELDTLKEEFAHTIAKLEDKTETEIEKIKNAG